MFGVPRTVPPTVVARRGVHGHVPLLDESESHECREALAVSGDLEDLRAVVVHRCCVVCNVVNSVI